MTCQARDCNEPIPARTYPGGAPKRYCSDTCRRRERDRRLNAYGTMDDRRQRAIAKETESLRRMTHRRETRALKAMLRDLKALEARLFAPCDCDSCRMARQREDQRDRRRQRMEDNKALIRDLKGGQCADCGETFDPQDLHFHHRDPDTKRANVSQMRAGGYTDTDIKEEVAKCDVLCMGCHRERHGVGDGSVA